MLGELVIRFLVGGLVVTTFAVLGDVLKPKSFAGLFGAAPSVALATLVLAYARDGADVASLEGRSMLLGAVALFVYSLLLRWLLPRGTTRVWAVAAACWAAWLGVALGLWWLVLA